jgi:phosphate transport system permease protein
VSITTRPAEPAAAEPVDTGSLRRAKPRYLEAFVAVLLFAAAMISVLVTVGILFAVFEPSAEFFRQVPFTDFLFGTKWSANFNPASYGVLPLLSATVLISLIAMVIAGPLGLASALYLSEYANDRTRKIVKPALEILAGFPTVILGLFALQFVTPVLQWMVPGDEYPEIFNALSAGIVIGVMIIPTIASLSEDAMSAVPQALRQGAFALGANNRQVATGVVVPAALSGIVASFVLGVSRAIGETMIVTIAAGNRANLSWNPLESMQTMTGYIAQTGSGDIPIGSLKYDTIFAVGALLFVLTFLMNMIAIRAVRKYRTVYQ